MNSQELTLVWAQWRSIRNYYRGSGHTGILFSALGSFLWFGGWTLGAIALLFLVARASDIVALDRALRAGFLLGLFYWQTIPIFIATAGISLDLKKLLAYPIPPERLFWIEVLLRATVNGEMLLVSLAVFIGLLFNRGVPFWGPVAIVFFAVFNLLLSAGLRDLLARLFARKIAREIAVFVLVLVTALPQLLVRAELPGFRGARWAVTALSSIEWPWTSTAQVSIGHLLPWHGLALLLWTTAAYAFARRQFLRSLRFDEAEAVASDRRKPARRSIFSRLYSWPSKVFRDPLGALVEKEVRFLARSPRFRLLFMMGFTFGLIIWIPVIFDRHPNLFLSRNFLTLVSLYAVLCLGDVSLWNTLGFDRWAVQNYYVLPIRFTTVLIAKNITSAFFIFSEIVIITVVCLALRLPITLSLAAEALAVTVVFTLYALAIGNLSSTYYPRAVDPGQSWRRGAGNRVQFMLLIIFPVLGLPISLAYLARFAFESQAAFYAVLAVDFLVGAIVYGVALDSAVEIAETRREITVATLSGNQGPTAN